MKKGIGPEPIWHQFRRIWPIWPAGRPGSEDDISPEMLRNTRKCRVSAIPGVPSGPPEIQNPHELWSGDSFRAASPNTFFQS